MGKPILYPVNALEAAFLVLTPDGPRAGQPLSRLVDRDIGLESADRNVLGQRTWQADLGAVPVLPAITTWIFTGAAYTGVTLTLQSSPNGTAWNTRATVVPSSDGPQRLVFAAVTARYWRWYATNPPAPLRFTEVWLTAPLQFQFRPTAASLREPQVPNVTLLESVSGRAWGMQRGARRWSTTYVMRYSPETDRALVFALLDATGDGAKPFWLVTLQDELRWVRMDGGVDFEAVDMTLANWDIPLTFVEELP